MKTHDGCLPYIKSIVDWDKLKCKSYLVEVDIDYPVTLHNKHRAYPRKISKLYFEESMRLGFNMNKEEHYVVEISRLIQMLNEGLLVTKVHRILECQVVPWMRDYIIHNTDKRNIIRRNGDNIFSTMYKMLNNAVYGKQLENPRLYREYRIVYGQKRLDSMRIDPKFKVDDSRMLHDGEVKVKTRRRIRNTGSIMTDVDEVNVTNNVVDGTNNVTNDGIKDDKDYVKNYAIVGNLSYADDPNNRKSSMSLTCVMKTNLYHEVFLGIYI